MAKAYSVFAIELIVVSDPNPRVGNASDSNYVCEDFEADVLRGFASISAHLCVQLRSHLCSLALAVVSCARLEFRLQVIVSWHSSAF